MKLSKVKKVCMDAGQIIVKKADTGIDINTWIGTNNALYPVRGLSMNAELCYHPDATEEHRKARFEACTGGDYDALN